MKYCKNCGEKLSANQTFCTNCGTQFDSREIAANRTMQKRERQQLSAKMKATIVSVIVILAVLAGSHLYFSAQSKPIKTVEKFEQAVRNKDAKALADIMNNGQNKLTVSDKEAASYINYLTKENDFKEISKELKRQAYSIEGYKKLEPIQDIYGNKLIKLKKLSKKQWLFYDQYGIEFFPIQLNVSSNLENTEIWLNGKKVKKLKESELSEKIGYIFPGEQKIKSVFNGEYAKLTAEDTLDFADSEENVLDVYMELDGASIVVYSNDENAVLFVNGKSTGKKIADIDSFGPVPTDGTIKLHAERTINGKTEKTEEFEVTDDSSIDFIFEEPETEAASAEADIQGYMDAIGEEQIESFMYDHFVTQVNAFNNRDFDVAKETLDPNGKSYIENRKYIKYLEEKGITEEFHDMELIDYEPVDGGFNVTTEESYTIYYGDGTSKYKEFRSKFYLTVLEEGLKVHTLIETKELYSDDL
ncbi:hypothetical protein C0966_12690 [Bacillus methanolicus]|uniref:zinc ribbon domain-containing protein n=1 Tax=Bacillus methanolicus TaxID=1471 RepID=UPI0023807FDF|nr:zinc-ribbon domain-containing protein [Bacillus methanolicus]MDE3840204.1 hypothetical protein [Bacillus methanolicus]